jgi:hypothetical protein
VACKERFYRYSGLRAVERVCTVCGCTYTRSMPTDRGKTCGRECAEKLRYRGERPCEFCGESFLAKRSWARFCSSACKQRAARRAAARVEPDGRGT